MIKLAAALVCLAASPMATVRAQQPGPTTAPRPAAVAASRALGPRLAPEFRSYQPEASQQETAASSAAAASDRITISISTLGLIVLGLVLILLLS